MLSTKDRPLNDADSKSTVAEIMVREVRTVTVETQVEQAAKILGDNGIRHLIVTSAGLTVGVFSERDLMKHTISCLSRDQHPGTSQVRDAMVESPLMVQPQTLISEAAAILAKQKIGCLPVIDDDAKLCGILSVVDVLWHTSSMSRERNSGDMDDHLRDEMCQLINDFEMAKLMYERHASGMTSLVEELKIANQQAETFGDAKRNFLANMSHEMRTPMTAILGYADVVLEDPTCESTVEAVQTIKRNGGHLLMLINDILDYSKIEANKLELEHVDCSIREIIKDVFQSLKPQADAKSLAINIEVDDNLPETTQSDPVRLRQILTNLLSNAIKFTKFGSIRIRVQYKIVASQAKIEFEVIDSGIGIIPGHISRIFEPFSQADVTTTRKYGGTGLGLSISKRLVEMLGGTFTVESELGVGSTFRFSIDASEVQAAGESSISLQKTTTDKPSNVAKVSEIDCRVLLAEDSVDNQRLLSFLLKKAGATVTVVDNGLIAYEMAMSAKSQGASFDVVLMDMQMPVLDGYKATQKLRAAGYDSPIIALTAHAMKGDRERCLEFGCDDFVAKPVDRSYLIEKIAEYSQLTTQR